jgi:hypothetical protein
MIRVRPFEKLNPGDRLRPYPAHVLLLIQGDNDVRSNDLICFSVFSN